MALIDTPAMALDRLGSVTAELDSGQLHLVREGDQVQRIDGHPAKTRAPTVTEEGDYFLIVGQMIARGQLFGIEAVVRKDGGVDMVDNYPEGSSGVRLIAPASFPR